MAPSKTTRPAVASAVSRARLFRQLQRASVHRLTWVCGPPGAGKSTLVSSYIATRRLKSIWYQLDESDGDPATFFYYLSQAAPRRRRKLPMFTPEYRQGLLPFTRRFFRDLTARYPGEFAFVFDNYHELPPDAELHDVLKHVVDELPVTGRLIIISRGEPPPAFARLRAHRSMTIVDWDDLRFTAAETERLARVAAPGRWPPAAVRALRASTDGWGAGIVLLANQNTVDKPVRDTSGPSDVLFDYFAAEIFKNVASDVQDVLLHTAWLPRVTSAMAAALTGRPDAGDALVRLHQQNFFTTRRTSAEAIYEYHPLFRRFLLAQASRSYSSGRLNDIRRRAALLADEHHMLDAAVSLFQECGDLTALAGFINRHAPQLLAQGRGVTVERWLGLLPSSMIDETPWLLYWRGLCSFAWRHTDSQRDLEQAFLLFRRHGESAGSFLAWSTLIIALQGESNTDAIDQWMIRFDELTRENVAFPSKEVETHVAAAMLSAICVRQPQRSDARQWAERALKLAAQHADPTFRCITVFNWVFLCLELGDHANPTLPGLVQEMRALMREREQSAAVRVNAGLPVIWYEAMMGLPSYRQTAEAVIQIAQSAGMFHAVRTAVLSGGIHAAIADGDMEAAEAWTLEYGKDLASFGPGYRCWYHGFLARIALARGDVGRAEAQRALMRGLDGGCILYTAETLTISARVLARRGDIREARKEIARAWDAIDIIRSPYADFMVGLVEAEVCLENGDDDDGIIALRRAFSIGRQHDFMTTLAWDPHAVARLCARALEFDIEADYALKLIRLRHLTLTEPAIDLVAWPWPIKLYTFGPFEIVKDERPLNLPTKMQRKPMALLKALVAFGARGVREDRLTDLLWPDAVGDTGRFALTTTIHRLRRLLDREEAIVRRGNEISLNPQVCWVDLLAVQNLLQRAERVPARLTGESTEYDSLIRRILALYRGPCFGDEEDAAWARPVAGDVRRRVLKLLVQCATRSRQRGRMSEAIELLEQGARIDSCSEEVCRGLMICYDALGRREDVHAAYRRCRDSLETRIGVTPSPETSALLKRLHDPQKG